MRKTIVTPWTVEWSKLFIQEEKTLRDIIQANLEDIYHIGSTSVPAIGYAKPIIDILIVVADIEKIDFHIDKLKKIGYMPRGENGIPGRRYFTKGKDKRTHHLHIFQIGNESIKIHLALKNICLNIRERLGSMES